MLLAQKSPARQTENAWIFVSMAAHKSRNALRVRIRITHTHHASRAYGILAFKPKYTETTRPFMAPFVDGRNILDMANKI